MKFKVIDANGADVTEDEDWFINEHGQLCYVGVDAFIYCDPDEFSIVFDNELLRQANEFLNACREDWANRTIVANKEIDRLRNALDVEALYCQKHAAALSDSDPSRASRHRERAERLRGAMYPKVSN